MRFARAVQGTLLLWMAWAEVAHAHPRIDAARQAYEEAGLESAAAAIEQAFELGNLTRDEYLNALAFQALIASSRADGEVVDATFRQLASIDPGFELPPETPPSLRRRYDRVVDALQGERVGGQLRIARSGERFAADLSLTDPASVVLDTQIDCRTGDKSFRGEGANVSGLTSAHHDIACLAQLRGVGGTVLAELEERSFGIERSEEEVRMGEAWWDGSLESPWRSPL